MSTSCDCYKGPQTFILLYMTPPSVCIYTVHGDHSPTTFSWHWVDIISFTHFITNAICRSTGQLKTYPTWIAKHEQTFNNKLQKTRVRTDRSACVKLINMLATCQKFTQTMIQHQFVCHARLETVQVRT